MRAWRMRLVLALVLIFLAIGLLTSGVLPLSFYRTDLTKGVWAEITTNSDILLHNTSDATVHVVRVDPNGNMSHKSVNPGYHVSLGSWANGWSPLSDETSTDTGIRPILSTVVKSSPLRIELRWENVGKVHPLGLLYRGRLMWLPAMILNWWGGEGLKPESTFYLSGESLHTIFEPTLLWHDRDGYYFDNECCYLIYTLY